MEKPVLQIWTIFFSPRDFPDEWVARKFIFGAPTKDIIRAESLDELRKLIQKNSDYERVKIPRSENDHPSVIESWI